MDKLFAGAYIDPKTGDAKSILSRHPEGDLVEWRDVENEIDRLRARVKELEEDKLAESLMDQLMEAGETETRLRAEIEAKDAEKKFVHEQWDDDREELINRIAALEQELAEAKKWQERVDNSEWPSDWEFIVAKHENDLAEARRTIIRLCSMLDKDSPEDQTLDDLGWYGQLRAALMAEREE